MASNAPVEWWIPKVPKGHSVFTLHFKYDCTLLGKQWKLFCVNAKSDDKPKCSLFLEYLATFTKKQMTQDKCTKKHKTWSREDIFLPLKHARFGQGLRRRLRGIQAWPWWISVDYAWFDWAIADSLIADIYRDSINCHSRIRFIGGTDSIYKVCKGISPQNMDSTSILGSWNSHWL